MAFMFLFNNHVQNVDQIVNEEELITQHRINRKRLRDACDPFEVPDSCFRQNFRLSKDCVRGLIQRLSPHLVTQHARANGLTPTHKVGKLTSIFGMNAFQCLHSCITVLMTIKHKLLTQLIMLHKSTKRYVSYEFVSPEIYLLLLSESKLISEGGCLDSLCCTDISNQK